MNSHIVKLILFSCLIFQAGCDITFKRKTTNNVNAQVKMSKQNIISSQNDSEKKLVKSGASFSNSDSDTITLYYSDIANAIVRKDMIRRTTLSKKEAKNIVEGKHLPRDIQVMPLPLKLERTLSSLPLHVLRVQVGIHIILMNVKSRRILDVVKI